MAANEYGTLGKPSTRDINAYEYYLRGRKFFYKYNKRGVAFARELFDRAIAIDPGYARAFAGISDCFSYQYMYGGRDPADLERAITAASPRGKAKSRTRGMATRFTRTPKSETI